MNDADESLLSRALTLTSTAELLGAATSTQQVMRSELDFSFTAAFEVTRDEDASTGGAGRDVRSLWGSACIRVWCER